MPTFSNIEQLVSFGFDVFNVFTQDSNWVTKDGKPMKNCAKTPCKHGRYAFKGWEKASHDELKDAINYNHDGFGLRLGKQHNQCRIMSLDFDICGDKNAEAKRIGCSETEKLWDQYRAGAEIMDGAFTSSTAGNYNVLIDYTACDDIIDLIDKIGIAKIGKYHLEVLLAGNQVIPPTATICKHTGKLGKPRTFMTETPFKIITCSDWVHTFIKTLLEEYIMNNEPKQKMIVKRVMSATVSESDSNDDVINNCDSEHYETTRELLLEWIGGRFKPDGINKRDKYEFYDSLKIASALKTLGIGPELWCSWCKLGAKRAIKDPMIIWNAVEDWENKTIAFLCLENILKRYDKNQFRIWRISHHSEDVMANMNTSEENTKAKFIAKELGRELVYCGEQWFMLNQETKLWSVVKKPHALVSNHLFKLLGDEMEAYVRKLNDADTDDKREQYKKVIRRIADIKIEVGRANTMSSILVFLSTYLCDNKFREKLDINLYRMPYRNGMLCLKTLTFRKGILPSDLITKTVDFDYVEPTDKELNWVKHEMKKIFNWNDTHLDYGMSFYGYSMTGDARREQNFWCMKGENASNGKSIVLTSLTDIMPEFVTCFPSELFEVNYGERHKMIATWNGLKIGWLNELRKGKKQDEAFMKLVAEATPQEYKVMFGTMSKMPLTFKTILVGNHSLKVDADQGIKRRYRHLQMNADFQDDNEDDYETLKFKKDKDFGKLLTTTYRNAFLYYIYMYSKAYYVEQKMKPYPIEWEIVGKQIMDDNNEVDKWFNKHFEIDVNAQLDNHTFTKYVDEKIVTNEELKSLRKKYNYDSQKMGGYYDVVDKDGKLVKKQAKGMWFGFKVRETEIDDE